MNRYQEDLQYFLGNLRYTVGIPTWNQMSLEAKIKLAVSAVYSTGLSTGFGATKLVRAVTKYMKATEANKNYVTPPTGTKRVHSNISPEDKMIKRFKEVKIDLEGMSFCNLL